jgi:hypothetical protein
MKKGLQNPHAPQLSDSNSKSLELDVDEGNGNPKNLKDLKH